MESNKEVLLVKMQDIISLVQQQQKVIRKEGKE